MNQIILKDKTHQFKEWIISTDEETGHMSAHLELIGDWESVLSVIRRPGLLSYYINFGTSTKLWPLYFFYQQHFGVFKNPSLTMQEGIDLVEKMLIKYNKLLCFA